MKIDNVSLECRDMRHAWQMQGDIIVHEKRGIVRVFSRVLFCPRCNATRTDTYRIGQYTVDREGSKYVYPKGYQVKGGLPVAKARHLLFAGMLNQEQ